MFYELNYLYWDELLLLNVYYFNYFNVLLSSLYFLVIYYTNKFLPSKLLLLNQYYCNYFNVVWCSLFYLMNYYTDYFNWWNIKLINSWHEPPLTFITCHGTTPLPTSWQTTSCIHRKHPASGRQVRLETSCAGGAELFLCHRLVQEEVFRVYSQ